jgi:regulatory protein
VKITAISKQVKRAGRFSVFIDGKFAFGVSESQLIEFGIAPNQEITEQKLKQLKDATNEQKTLDRILNLLSIRPRSTWELQDYLKRKQQSPATIEKILNKLSKLGYIDDKSFAKRWVENKRHLQNVSSLKLRHQLKQKRISDEIIDKALANSGDQDKKALKAMVERKKDRYKDKTKFMQHLARQGFRYEDIKNALKED